jgi:DNA repair exonuclease SbcCD ATPase subunit/DNA repair exonuclease SbcCD nuclease subunit
VLIIAGDIFENKTYLNTDDIYIFNRLMDMLESRKIRTIVIPGNHDYNVNSSLIDNNIDALLPKYKYIRCVSKTCEVNIENVSFGIFSPIDKKIPNQRAGLINVAILHETIIGAYFDNDEYINEGRFSADSFAGWDYVMLGDIHKPQFMRPNIAYAGSFVQKNRGEGLDHGYILWDLNAKSGKHVFIPLLEVYLKLEAINNSCRMPELQPNQKVRYITLLYRKCSAEYLAELKKKIEDKYGFINKIIDKNNYSNSVHLRGQVDTDEKNNLIVNTAEILSKLLDESKLGDKIKNKVLESHSKICNDRKLINYTNYKINYIYWSNVLCYGEDNYIDFREFSNDIVILNGSNQSGKSSIIDIIIRVLFNEHYRGKKDKIINEGKRWGEIRMSLSIGQDEYIIEQQFSHKKVVHKLLKNSENITQDKINNTYSFLKNTIGLGEYKDFVNMTVALQNRQFLVDMEKKDLLGLLTKILDIDMLYDIEKKIILELRSNRRILKVAEQETKYFQPSADNTGNYAELKVRLSELKANRETLITHLQTLNKALTSTKCPANYETIINTPKLQPEPKTYDRQKLEHERLLLSTKLTGRNFEPTGNPISEAEYRNNCLRITELSQTAEASDAEYDKAEYYGKKSTEQYKDTKHLYLRLTQHKDKIAGLPDIMTPEMIAEYAELQPSKKEHPRLGLSEAELHRLIIPASEPLGDSFIKYLNMLKFNSGCTECQHNKQRNESKVATLPEINKKIRLSNEAREDIKIIENLKAWNRKEYLERIQHNVAVRINEEIQREIKAISDNNQQIKEAKFQYEKIKKNEAYILLKKLQAENENYMAFKETKIRQKIAEINTELNKIKIYEQMCEDAKEYSLAMEYKMATEKNKHIQQEIQQTEKLISDANRLIDANIERQKDLSSSINIEAEKKKNRERIGAQIAGLKDEIEWMEVYLKMIEHKNGIPSILLKNVCSLLTDRINKVLCLIANFEIRIEYKNEFEIYTVESGKMISADVGSGYQKFVIDIIMRMVLTNISVISNPNIIFIDEGFGCLDKENFIEVAKVIKKLKSNFDAIVIITHISELKAYGDKSINVVKDRGNSIVRYGQEIKSSNLSQPNALEMVIEKDSQLYCNACKKYFKNCKNAKEKHISAKTYRRKHEAYTEKK